MRVEGEAELSRDCECLVNNFTGSITEFGEELETSNSRFVFE